MKKNKRPPVIELAMLTLIFVGIAATTYEALQVQSLQKYAMVDPGGAGGSGTYNPQPAAPLGDNPHQNVNYNSCANVYCDSGMKCQNGRCIPVNNPPNMTNISPFKPPSNSLYGSITRGMPNVCHIEIQVFTACAQMDIPVPKWVNCNEFSKCAAPLKNDDVHLLDFPTPAPILNVIGQESGAGLNDFTNTFPAPMGVGGTYEGLSPDTIPEVNLLPQEADSNPSLLELIINFFKF